MFVIVRRGRNGATEYLSRGGIIEPNWLETRALAVVFKDEATAQEMCDFLNQQNRRLRARVERVKVKGE